MLQSIAIMCCIDKSTNYAPNSFALLSAVLKVEYKYHSNRFYLSCKLSKWCINTWEITTQKWWWPKLNVGLGNDGKKSSRLFIMVDLKVCIFFSPTKTLLQHRTTIVGHSFCRSFNFTVNSNWGVKVVQFRVVLRGVKNDALAVMHLSSVDTD